MLVDFQLEAAADAAFRQLQADQPNSTDAVIEVNVPGAGVQSADTVVFFVIKVDVPELSSPTVIGSTETVEFRSQAVVQAASEFGNAATTEKNTAEERTVWLQIVAADGSVQEVPMGEDVLENLPERIYKKLPDGKYRILLQEAGETRKRLLFEVIIRDGKPADESATQRDRPPTQPMKKAIEPKQEAQPAAKPDGGAALAPMINPADLKMARVEQRDQAWAQWAQQFESAVAEDVAEVDPDETEITTTSVGSVEKQHPVVASAFAAGGLIVAQRLLGKWKDRVDNFMAQWTKD